MANRILVARGLVRGSFPRSLASVVACVGLMHLAQPASSATQSTHQLDPAFAPAVTAAGGAVYGFATQSDGKVVVAGEFIAVGQARYRNLARLNANGTIDLTFNPGDGPDGPVYAVACQTNDLIVIGGDFNQVGGVPRKRIARLLADGRLDTAFDPGAGITTASGAGFIAALAVQPGNGAILAGGYFTIVNSTGHTNLVRLLPSGAVDAGFKTRTDTNHAVLAFAIQNDGKILVGGTFTSVNGSGRNGIARLKTDGTLDTSFSVGTGVGGIDGAGVYAILIQPDGKVVIGGAFKQVAGKTRGGLARLTTSGSVDSAFDTGAGTEQTGAIYSLTRQSDGNLLIGGTFSSFRGSDRNGVARVTTTGALDKTYDPGSAAPVYIYALAFRADGALWVGGNFSVFGTSAREGLVRLTSAGAVDPAFQQDLGMPGVVRAAVCQQDGRTFIAGQFTAVNGVRRLRIARLNVDGSVDPEFDPGLGVGVSATSDDVVCLALQADGKILLGGEFKTVNGVAINRLARLNPNGVVDTSFVPGTGPERYVSNVALDSQHRIVVGGYFTNFNGSARAGVARLLSDGRADPAFNPGTGATYVMGLATQPDDKILVGGEFTNFNSVARTRIARLNANGSVDTTLDPRGSADGFVTGFALQEDGRILVHGSFAQMDGQPRTRIARLHPDGRLDTNFYPVLDTEAYVARVVVHPDQRIYVAGHLRTVNEVPRGGLARLYADGALDTLFNVGDGTTDQVNAVALSPDGAVLVGGNVTQFNGVGRPGVARMHAEDVAAPTISPFGRTGQGGFRLTLTCEPGWTHRVEFAEALATGSGDTVWHSLTNILTTNALSTVVDPDATRLRRFYRVRVMQ